MSLTDLQIKKLRVPEKGQKTYFDDALSGFGVRVSQGGTKTFIVLCGKARKRYSLGRYPKMSLAEARRLAKRTQADAALDGIHDIDAAPDVSFETAREKFLQDCEARTKPRTVEEYRRLLRRHFHFEKSLGEIDRSAVVAAIEVLRTTPSEQKHAFVAIRTMMNWCRKRGLIDATPVPALTFKTEARARILTDSELVAIWQRAEQVGYPYGRIVQLLILTGQRRGEIAGLRRSWIQNGEIVYPPGFVKNSREHVVPMGHMATELIGELPECADLLFPSRLSNERPFNGFSKSKRSFDRPLSFDDYTLHDIRRTFSSTMARLGTPIHITERLLNHASGAISGVAAIYNRHSYRDEMREAMSAYEDHLANLIRRSPLRTDQVR